MRSARSSPSTDPRGRGRPRCRNGSRKRQAWSASTPGRCTGRSPWRPAARGSPGTTRFASAAWRGIWICRSGPSRARRGSSCRRGRERGDPHAGDEHGSLRGVRPRAGPRGAGGEAAGDGTGGGRRPRGRDTGTVVFPDAEAKFFLDAAAAVRARRRYLELSLPASSRSRRSCGTFSSATCRTARGSTHAPGGRRRGVYRHDDPHRGRGGGADARPPAGVQR